MDTVLQSLRKRGTFAKTLEAKIIFGEWLYSTIFCLLRGLVTNALWYLHFCYNAYVCNKVVNQKLVYLWCCDAWFVMVSQWFCTLTCPLMHICPWAHMRFSTRRGKEQTFELFVPCLAVLASLCLFTSGRRNVTLSIAQPSY